MNGNITHMNLEAQNVQSQPASVEATANDAVLDSDVTGGDPGDSGAPSRTHSQQSLESQRSSRASMSPSASPRPPATPVLQTPRTPSHGNVSFDAARRALVSINNSFFSSPDAAAQRALDKCVNGSPKPPLPTYIQAVIDISHHRTNVVSPTVQGQNVWLVTQLQARLQKCGEEHVVAKIMMLTHDLLVYGAREFANALAPVAESYFNADLLCAAINESRQARGVPRLPSYSGIRDDPDVYEDGGRFFVAYVHALLQFQLRHRTDDNPLDPDSPDVILRIRNEEDIFWTPYMRDVVLSCVALTKFIVAASSAIPCYCFIFAEILRRYVADSGRLYHVLSRAMQLMLITSKKMSEVPISEIHKNRQCMKHYVRVTDQLNEFYDTLQALPEGSLFEKDLIPDRLQQLPSFLHEKGTTKFRKLQDLENMKIETLESVLSSAMANNGETSTDDATVNSSIDRRLNSSTTVVEVRIATTAPSEEHAAKLRAADHQAQTSELLMTSHDDDNFSFASAQSFLLERLTASSEQLQQQQELDNATGGDDSDERPRPRSRDVSQRQGDIVLNPNREIDSSRFDGDDDDFADDDDDEDDDNLDTAFLHRENTATLYSPNRRLADENHNTTNDPSSTSLLGDAKSRKQKRNASSFLQASVVSATSDSAPSSSKGSRKSTDDASRARFSVYYNQVLGQGGFGTVYKAWDEQEGKHVACKEVKLAVDADRSAGIDELKKEYRVLTTLEHPNIVKVLGFVVHQGHGRIFMEWVPSGSVQTVLQETHKGLRETIVRRYVREALQGLAYLHSRGIVHRDVKPGNMLLASDGSVKLTDFGTSRKLEDGGETMQTGTVVGTVPYLAPECVRGTYSAASDVWAIGCTALHMITGKAPWVDEARDHIALIFKIGNFTAPPRALLEYEMSDELRSFISAAMTADRHLRPTAEKLLQHAFIEPSKS